MNQVLVSISALFLTQYCSKSKASASTAGQQECLGGGLPNFGFFGCLQNQDYRGLGSKLWSLSEGKYNIQTSTLSTLSLDRSTVGAESNVDLGYCPPLVTVGKEGSDVQPLVA